MTAQSRGDAAHDPTPQPHRALVLHDSKLIADLLELTLNHGLFVVHSAMTLEDAERYSRHGCRTSRWWTWSTRQATLF
ncbi:MAG TPA: hypothetical protein VF364_04400 [Candidatus Limnocylindria bacterium]